MTQTDRSAAPRELTDFEPFARCWIADDGTTATDRAREWVTARLGPRGLTVSEFRWGDLDDPASMPTIPLPHPAEVVVAGVSDAGSRRRARALVNLFGCSIAIVPEGGATGHGVICGVDHITNAAMTATAAAIEAEYASEPLLLVHAVPAQLAPFSTRPDAPTRHSESRGSMSNAIIPPSRAPVGSARRLRSVRSSTRPGRPHCWSSAESGSPHPHRCWAS